jgi:SpoVK/Ycf46/Vps4 family AAA+-type ATPase
LRATLPAASWCAPIKSAFSNLLDETKLTAGSARQEIWKFVCDGSQRDHRPANGNTEVVNAISKSESIVGISPDPKKFLPRTLSAASDFLVVVCPLSGAQIQEVIANITGRKPRRPLSDQLVAGLDPADLAVAIRPGSKVSDCEARLRKIAAARVVQIGDDIPRLETLSGCDDAREWGLNLAIDIALYKEGRIGWNEVAEVGAILVGPPGCGKTQVAKSLSRTLGIPLISTSYAAWQSSREGHLGDLLAEMKRSAAEALSLAPSIWFCDEVDSMPNRNDSDLRYREWYVAIVNAMLELCERAARPGVILLGACNDASRMDAALMRAGRFGDRIIEIPRPDEAALAGILRHHLAGDLATTDMLRVARSALGATGADVAGWVRGARRLARNESRVMCPDDLMQQILPDDDRSAEDIRRAAVHEAGHCVAMIVTGQRVEFVSILTMAGTGGQTTAPALGTDFPTREDFERTITILLCGRAAEEVLIGAPSAASSGGPHSDLARATDLIVGMYAAWGMGKAPVVHVHFRKASDMLHADADLRRVVEENMADIYRRALKVIADNAPAVTLIAERLIAARHLDWNEIERTLKSTSVPLPKSIAPGSIVPDLAKSADASVADKTTRTVSSDPAIGRKSNRGKRQLRGLEP